MFARLLILLVLAAALLWFLHWFRRTPSQQVARVLRRTALWGAIGLVLVLAFATRNVLFAALAMAVPVVMRAISLLRALPAIQQVLRSLGITVSSAGAAASRASPGQGSSSSIRTRFLQMTLEHASGRMDGLVREGSFQGRLLSDLELTDLLDLLAHCRAEDAQSAALLEAYLDRTQGDDWRAASPGHGERAAPTDAPMGREEALAILGLDSDASEQDIRDAHRRLIQKFHPDRGGSDYLAAKINAAKRLLLGE